MIATLNRLRLRHLEPDGAVRRSISMAVSPTIEYIELKESDVWEIRTEPTDVIFCDAAIDSEDESDTCRGIQIAGELAQALPNTPIALFTALPAAIEHASRQLTAVVRNDAGTPGELAQACQAIAAVQAASVIQRTLAPQTNHPALEQDLELAKKLLAAASSAFGSDTLQRSVGRSITRLRNGEELEETARCEMLREIGELSDLIVDGVSSTTSIVELGTPELWLLSQFAVRRVHEETIPVGEVLARSPITMQSLQHIEDFLLPMAVDVAVQTRVDIDEDALATHLAHYRASHLAWGESRFFGGARESLDSNAVTCFAVYESGEVVPFGRVDEDENGQVLVRATRLIEFLDPMSEMEKVNSAHILQFTLILASF